MDPHKFPTDTELNNQSGRPRLDGSNQTTLQVPSPSRRVRASSEPPAVPGPTIDPENGVQCSGITRQGNRCKNVIKSEHPLTLATPAPVDAVERFCHQHRKDILQQSGFHAHDGKNTWVDFDDWIPQYLSDETKTALRIEMEKPASAADVPGYIYAYEIRNPKATDEFNIKVGRAVNVVKRLDEWSKQCGSKEVILRGWWPGNVIHDASQPASTLKGRIVAGEKGKHCHRLERLIHLELSDLVINEPFLKADFARPFKKNAPPVSGQSPARSRRSSVSSATAKVKRSKCPDCGKIHKEIFTFDRVKQGRLKNHEWELITLPVIKRWGDFVEKFM